MLFVSKCRLWSIPQVISLREQRTTPWLCVGERRPMRASHSISMLQTPGTDITEAELDPRRRAAVHSRPFYGVHHFLPPVRFQVQKNTSSCTEARHAKTASSRQSQRLCGQSKRPAAQREKTTISSGWRRFSDILHHQHRQGPTTSCKTRSSYSGVKLRCHPSLASSRQAPQR